nr:MAG TPA: hypothetical protein [Caudoviricetes sp.]DAH64962.1 MAG TPA: hypothetical protein [Bacteriophage sp.]DAZ84937.1 MAG TPA: hypothetical protein [Caudoviricetes sp.]
MELRLLILFISKPVLFASCFAPEKGVAERFFTHKR